MPSLPAGRFQDVQTGRQQLAEGKTDPGRKDEAVLQLPHAVVQAELQGSAGVLAGVEGEGAGRRVR